MTTKIILGKRNWYLTVATLEVDHPVAKRLQRVWRQATPRGGQLTIEERTGNLVQLVAHADLTGEGLRGENHTHKRTARN